MNQIIRCMRKHKQTDRKVNWQIGNHTKVYSPSLKWQEHSRIYIYRELFSSDLAEEKTCSAHAAQKQNPPKCILVARSLSGPNHFPQKSLCLPLSIPSSPPLSPLLQGIDPPRWESILRLFLSARRCLSPTIVSLTSQATPFSLRKERLSLSPATLLLLPWAFLSSDCLFEVCPFFLLSMFFPLLFLSLLTIFLFL